MTRRLLTAFSLALVLSAACTVWLGRRIARTAHAAVAQKQYVAAARNLVQGATLHADDVKFVDWPVSLSVDGGFQKLDAVIGHALLYPLGAGQPILASYVAGPNTVPGLSARIPTGMRAISLRSDEVAGVAGFAEPGTHVDVLVTSHSATGSDAVTQCVLQDVAILAAGQNTQADPDGKATTADVVTLLVTLQDAEKVARASAQGTVHFVLRNGADREQIADSVAGMQQARGAPELDVHSAQQARGDAAPERQPYTVLTVNGDKQTSETFQ